MSTGAMRQAMALAEAAGFPRAGDSSHPPPMRGVPRAALTVSLPWRRQGRRRSHAVFPVLSRPSRQHARESARADLRRLPFRHSKGAPLNCDADRYRRFMA